MRRTDDREDGDAAALRQWTVYLERVRAGESVDLQQYCASHPDLQACLFGEETPPASFLDHLLDRMNPAPPAGASVKPEPSGAESPDGAPDPLKPVGTRYDIRGELGRGGMGAILRAFDPQLDRELAMKVILDGEDGERARRLLPRFLQEARIMGQLEHPGIVPVHELGIDDLGRVYFTMRRVEGIDLGDVIALYHQGDPEWTLPRVLGVLSRATDAVAYAHSRGIIHRDLKPANIRVGSFGETYVMDWGLAKVLERDDGDDASEEVALGPLHTLVGTVVGTPQYMAPEQAAGQTEDLDARTDVYAMGAILYEVLAGHAPYSEHSRSAREIVERVQESPPIALSQEAHRQPPELVAIAEKAMARNPDLRYPTMVEMADDLRASLENRVVQAHRTGALVELRLWVRRNRGTAASLLALVLVSLIGAVLWRIDSERSYQKILPLAEGQRLTTAIRLEKTLDPPTPDRVPLFEAWLEEHALPLLERLPEFRAELEQRERLALEYSEEEREHDLATHPSLPDLEARLQERNKFQKDAIKFPKRAADCLAWVAELDEEIAALTSAVEARRTWRFATEEEHERHAHLNEYIPRLEAFQAPGGLLDRVRQRLEHARTVDERTIRSPEAVAAWNEAIAAIAASEVYGNLEIQPQLGLLPLGQNEAGLWEFWHVGSGDRPALAAPGSPCRYRVTPEIGIVFILIPPATATIGVHPFDFGFAIEEIDDELRVTRVTEGRLGDRAGLRVGDILLRINGKRIANVAGRALHIHAVRTTGVGRFGVLRDGEPLELVADLKHHFGTPGFDPYAPPDESPRHPVVLDEPYFLAKFELTQGQWLRLTGTNPCQYPIGYPIPWSPPITAAHPLENVSWNDMSYWLARWRLTLPTEVQWEHAARGGTSTIWSTGDDPNSLEGFANVYDFTAHEYLQHRHIPGEFDDGWIVHAPVGLFRPNPFGFHDVHGNVQEFCRDWSASYRFEARRGDGLRHDPEAKKATTRGGAWNVPPVSARCAVRGGPDPDHAHHSFGARAARRLDRERR